MHGLLEQVDSGCVWSNVLPLTVRHLVLDLLETGVQNDAADSIHHRPDNPVHEGENEVRSPKSVWSIPRVAINLGARLGQNVENEYHQIKLGKTQLVVGRQTIYCDQQHNRQSNNGKMTTHHNDVAR